MKTETFIQILIAMFITFFLIIMVASGDKLLKKEPKETIPSQAEASAVTPELPVVDTKG